MSNQQNQHDILVQKKKYQQHIHDIILKRFWMCVPLAILIHLLLTFVDQIIHPQLVQHFFSIRIVDSIILFLLLILSLLPSLKKYCYSLVILSAITLTTGLAFMSFGNDGSSSHAYESVNLIILGLGYINPFNFRLNLYLFLCLILITEIPMLYHHSPFNYINFTISNFYLLLTVLFVSLMTKIYSDQHYKAFIRLEQLRANEAKLALAFNNADKLSKTDELTDIPNRRFFIDILRERIKLCESAQSEFYLIIFDIDHFKSINDSYGHSFGDIALNQVAECVRHCIRLNDVIGRLGGDEFVLIMQGIPHDTLIKRLTIIQQKIQQLPLTVGDKTISLSVSFGAALFKPRHFISLEHLIDRADQELLNIKKTNRGGISIAD